MKHNLLQEEKSRLIVILLITFIGFVGASIAYPILPPLFLETHHHTIISPEWSMGTKRLLLGLTLALFSLGQFIGSPILGKHADLYGRKKVLIVSLIASTIGYVLTAIALKTNCFWLLLFSRFWTGLMEGTFSIVRAIAAEFTQIGKFISFGRINTMAAIGFIAGPLLGGFFSNDQIVPWFSYALPFTFAALASILALVLAYKKLPSYQKQHAHQSTPIWRQLNIVRQFKLLFLNHPKLKHLLIISTIFTFSVDIFYEFGPVFLAGKWLMSPAQISIYNVVLSITLALGASIIPHYLSKRASIKTILVSAMTTTALIFGCMVIFQYPTPMLLFFACAGLSITSVTTTITIHISNTAHPSIQGEVMGAQVSLRTLGEALICLVGGFMIIVSLISPIILSCLSALTAASLCFYYLRPKSSVI